MAHSFIEIGDRFLHWPDSRILTIFSLLLDEVDNARIDGADILRSDLMKNLSSPVAGMCDVNLDQSLAAGIDLGELNRRLQVRVSADNFISGEFLTKIALNAPNAEFEDCSSSLLLEWLEELLKLVG